MEKWLGMGVNEIKCTNERCKYTAWDYTVYQSKVKLVPDWLVTSHMNQITRSDWLRDA